MEKGEETCIKLKASMIVLQSFGNWLYRRGFDLKLCRSSWINIYLFACEYLIDDIASDAIDHMRSKYEGEQWLPNMNEIERIYDNTPEKSPLRQFVVFCFRNNPVSGQEAILESAPDSFVREFAIFTLPGAVNQFNTFGIWFGQPSGKSVLLVRVRLGIP
jgi:hypothetical protein